jgi:hypothetical protein
MCQQYYDLLLHGGGAVSEPEGAINGCCEDILGTIRAIGEPGSASQEACEDALHSLL